ncbi:MAG: N-acetylmuramoyl-L-alanine amidase family protein [bacterium]
MIKQEMRSGRLKSSLRKRWSISIILTIFFSTSVFSLSITSVAPKDNGDNTDLTISLDGPTKFDITQPEKYHLVLIIKNCLISDTIPTTIEDVGVIASLKIEVKSGSVYFDIYTNKGATRFKAVNKKKPPSIVLTIYGKKIEEKMETPKIETPKIKTEKGSLKVDTVVIDPGHGGHFTGAEGYSGTLEKLINLKVSKILKTLLEDKLGMSVYLTRESDTHVFLKDRTGLANKVGADLFISIHCNAYKDKKANGTETFFLSESKTDLDRAVAMRENADFLEEVKDSSAEMKDFLTMILASLTQNEFLEESSELAELVQTAMINRLGLKDRGVKQAPFYVLVGAYMPAILVEIAFISNKDEEQLLLDTSFQEKAAYAIYEGVKEFKERQEKRLGL